MMGGQLRQHFGSRGAAVQISRGEDVKESKTPETYSRKYLMTNGCIPTCLSFWQSFHIFGATEEISLGQRPRFMQMERPRPGRDGERNRSRPTCSQHQRCVSYQPGAKPQEISPRAIQGLKARFKPWRPSVSKKRAGPAHPDRSPVTDCRAPAHDRRRRHTPRAKAAP